MSDTAVAIEVRRVWLDVFDFRASIDDLESRVAGLPAHDDVEVAVLEFEHIEHVLLRYLKGELDAGSVARWVALIEMEDDVAYRGADDAAVENLIPDALAELSWPEGNGALTPVSAATLIDKLRRRTHSA